MKSSQQSSGKVGSCYDSLPPLFDQTLQLIDNEEQMDPTYKPPATQSSSKTFTQSSIQFTDDFKAKNQSLAEYLDESMTPDQAHAYERSHNSPLLEYLVKNDKSFDGLDMASPDNSYQSVFTSVRSFNLFWRTVDISVGSSPELLSIKEKYVDLFDGFHALCIMTPVEREVSWSHYVVKARRVKDDGTGLDFLRGTSKRNYLNGQMAGVKLYQRFVGENDDWTWTTFVRLNRVLDNTVLNNETNFTPKQIRGKNFVDFMDENQISVLKDFMKREANEAEVFSEKLRVYMHDFVQDLIIFGCPRARKEIAESVCKSFEVVDDTTLQFQQLGRFKSLKINSNKVANYKPARFIVSRRAVEIHQYLVSHRPHFAVPLGNQRLFLRPKDNVSANDKIWYSKRVMGEKFIGEAVSKYVLKLKAQGHALFQGNVKYTNTSLRKYHTNTLAEAGAPVQVLQESLGQNTRHYTQGANDMMNGLQAAEIIGGKRNTWQNNRNFRKSKLSLETCASQPKQTIDQDSDDEDDLPLAQLFPNARLQKKKKCSEKLVSVQQVQKITKSSEKLVSIQHNSTDDSASNKYPKLHFKIGELEFSMG